MFLALRGTEVGNLVPLSYGIRNIALSATPSHLG